MSDHWMDHTDRTKWKHSDEASCHEAHMDRTGIKTGFRHVMPARTKHGPKKHVGRH